jgi:hypothetical protein
MYPLSYGDFFTFNIMYEDLIFNQGVTAANGLCEFQDFLTHVPYFEKIKIGLRDRLVCVYPTNTV